MVCVTGPRQVVAPLGRCGMSCCAHGLMGKGMCAPPERATSFVPPCCRGSHFKAARTNGSARILNAKSCRCETRVSVLARPVAVTLRATSASHHVFPAVVPETPEAPTAAIVVAAPGIFGTDSGPPPDNSRYAEQSRAPPTS